MGSRETILGKVRRRQQRGGDAPAPAELEQMTTYLRRHPRGPLPELGEDLVARFRERAEASAASVDRVARESELPDAVARYLGANDLPKSGCVWPSLAHIDWSAAGIALEARAARGEDLLGITGVFFALAETGTLVVASGAGTPSNVSLLPETHVAVVPLGRLVAHMEDAWELLRAGYGQLPRAVNFISGPSRTADIEQTLVLGAHGPYRVHIVLVG